MCGRSNLITVDIGGTSADISTIPDGRIKIMNARDSYVNGHPNSGADDRSRFDRRRRRIDRLYRFRRRLSRRAALGRRRAGPRLLRPRRRRADRDRCAGRSRPPRCRQDAGRRPAAQPRSRAQGGRNQGGKAARPVHHRRRARHHQGHQLEHGVGDPLQLGRARHRPAGIRAGAVRRRRPAARDRAGRGHCGERDHRAGRSRHHRGDGASADRHAIRACTVVDRVAQARRSNRHWTHQHRHRRTGRSVPARSGEGRRDRGPTEISKDWRSVGITARASSCARSSRTEKSLRPI